MSATDAVLFERWQTTRDAEAFTELVSRTSIRAVDEAGATYPEETIVLQADGLAR